MAAEPIPVLPLEYENRADTAARLRWRLTRSQWLLASAWAACLVAWGLIVSLDVQTVVVTGPVIALLGLATAFTGLRIGRRAYQWIGAADVAICVLFVTLVNWLSWSPRDATLPFTVMGAMHVIGTGIVTARIIVPALRRQQQQQQQQQQSPPPLTPGPRI